MMEDVGRLDMTKIINNQRMANEDLCFSYAHFITDWAIEQDYLKDYFDWINTIPLIKLINFFPTHHPVSSMIWTEYALRTKKRTQYKLPNENVVKGV